VQKEYTTINQMLSQHYWNVTMLRAIIIDLLKALSILH